MRTKTKLNLGVGLLFVMIIILSLVSAYSIFSIKKDTENILRANYNTLEYSRNMLTALDNMDIDEVKADDQQVIHRVGQRLIAREAIDQKAAPVLVQRPRDPDRQRDADSEVDEVRENRHGHGR